MTSDYINTPQKLKYALQYWKNNNFHDTYINLQEALDKLNTKESLVDAHMDFSGRWMLRHSKYKEGNQEAIFYTAAVWMWNSDLETGNFVPPGATALGKVSESRLQDKPTSLCQITYAVDTTRDKTLYVAQRTLEKFMATQPGFNKGNKHRRQWQLGDGPFDTTYLFSASIFLRRAVAKHRERPPPYTLHPWIAQAMAEPNGQFFPNPDLPLFFEAAHGELFKIADCVPAAIQNGDLVWISFTVEFIIGGKAWNPNFVPVDIVRVGTVASHLVGTAVDKVPASAGSSAPQPSRTYLQPGQKFTMDMDFPMFDSDSAPSSPVASGSRTSSSLASEPHSSASAAPDAPAHPSTSPPSAPFEVTVVPPIGSPEPTATGSTTPAVAARANTAPASGSLVHDAPIAKPQSHAPTSADVITPGVPEVRSHRSLAVTSVDVSPGLEVASDARPVINIPSSTRLPVPSATSDNPAPAVPCHVAAPPAGVALPPTALMTTASALLVSLNINPLTSSTLAANTGVANTSSAVASRPHAHGSTRQLPRSTSETQRPLRLQTAPTAGATTGTELQDIQTLGSSDTLSSDTLSSDTFSSGAEPLVTRATAEDAHDTTFRIRSAWREESSPIEYLPESPCAGRGQDELPPTAPTQGTEVRSGASPNKDTSLMEITVTTPSRQVVLRVPTGDATTPPSTNTRPAEPLPPKRKRVRTGVESRSKRVATSTGNAPGASSSSRVLRSRATPAPKGEGNA